MAWDLLIRGGQIVTQGGVAHADIAVEGGTIAEFGADLRGAAKQEISAANLHVFPGLIDAHVHFNEPGRTDWEGFATGSAALAAGGGTCFFDMPLNASPPTLDAASFDAKHRAAEANSRTDFALWGGLTPDNLNQLEALAERGVIGFKAFMSNSGIDDFGRADDLTLYRGMEIAAKLGLPVAVHAENEELTAHLTAEAIRGGRTGVRDYLDSRPIITEVDAIRRAIVFARETRCPLHVVHVSSAAGVAEIAEARGVGVDVTAETCPHYLALTDDDVLCLGSTAKCAPPLRNADEVVSLRQQLIQHRIDFIASDHSPAPASMKQSDDFFKAWGGIAGVQSTLAVLLSHDAPPLPLDDIAHLIATNVATRFGIHRKGRIAPSFDADLTLIELSATYELTRDMLLDRHKLSPYIGRRFRGVVKRTIVRGHTVFADGRTVGDFRGRLVTPAREGAAHA